MGKLLVISGILLTFLLVGTGIYSSFHGGEAVGWVWCGLVVGVITLFSGLQMEESRQKEAEKKES